MKTNPLIFARNALTLLKQSKDYASDFISLRREFFNLYQGGFIFPTSITMDFFENIVYWLPRNDFVDNASKSHYIGNFNAWLKMARTIKYKNETPKI